MNTKWLKNIGHFVQQNSPTILTGMGVAGLVTTTVMGVRATPKALLLIEEEYERRDILTTRRGKYVPEGVEPLTNLDVFKLIWKCYIPTAIMGGATIACIIGANSIHLRRNAALASVYSLTETALKQYQNKVIEMVGEKKEREIRDDIAKDRVLENPPKDNQIIITGGGDVLCLDMISGRYFKNDIEKIRQAVNELNRQMISDMSITLNEFYDEIGLPHNKMGEDLGWKIETGMIKIDYSSQLTPSGDPCLTIDYDTVPLRW